MSPAIARAAIRNAASTGKRQFSLMSGMRDMARSFEPHPFQRLPRSERPQAGDYSKIIKRSGKSLLIYFPGMALILGWPVIARELTNGSV